MRFSTILSAVLATGVMAAPVKRALVEDIIVVTVTDYVYADGPAPTTTPDSSSTTTTSTTTTSTTPAYTPPVAAYTPPVAAYTPPVVIPSSTTTTPAYTPPPPPATSTSAAPVAAVVTPAPANTVEPASSAGSWNAPTTVISDLAVTDPTYTAIALAHHNVHRANHTADAVTYNSTLASWAQAKANSCVWNEDMPEGAAGVGMNIAQGTVLFPGNLGSVISDMWYNGELALFPGYNNPNLDVTSPAFQNWGHFSQVVWKGTTQIGCGSAPCGSSTSIGSGYFVACMYGPPGNYVGDFTQVGEPLGHPTVAVVGNSIVGV
ncbi:Mucin-2 [Lambiella insularis]|nr:Mucin-2 [Lambiella insularis]